MIEAIGSSASYQFQPQFRTENSLTEDQKETVQKILAKYDSNSITEEETKALFEELRAAGIRPCKEMDEILETAGIEKPEPPEGMPPKPEGGAPMENQPPDYVIELMDKIKSGEISEDEINQLLQNLTSDDQETSGVFVNTYK